jgi:hypothetical protein
VDEAQGEPLLPTVDEVRAFVEGFFVGTDKGANTILISDPNPDNSEEYNIIMHDSQAAADWLPILRDDLTTALCEFLGVTEDE